MHQTERDQTILSLLTENVIVTFRQLSNVLDASPATIRRDLNRLEKSGLVQRVHGGVKLPAKPSGEPTTRPDTLIENRTLKVAIGKRAAELVRLDEPIILNGGTTTYAMAQALLDHQAQILTNSNLIARLLLTQSRNRVFVPGGEIFREQSLILSPFDNDVIRNFHGGTMFLGAHGIGPMGIMENDHLLVQAEQKLLQRAERLVLLVESEKFKRRASLVLCELSHLSIVVTDDGISKQDCSMLEKSGVEVITIPKAIASKSHS